MYIPVLGLIFYLLLKVLRLVRRGRGESHCLLHPIFFSFSWYKAHSDLLSHFPQRITTLWDDNLVVRLCLTTGDNLNILSRTKTKVSSL